jgi:periplasmic copper chaperone A
MLAFRRLVTAGVLGAALAGLAAAPALAHVSVVTTDATQGGIGVITFRVPTESESASTTKVTVQLPPDQPLASVSVRPLPGWTHKETTAKLPTPITNDDGEQVSEAVSTVEWTAASPADAIKPGEYGEFSIDAGPLPKAPTITFKAIQTYSDGSQVAWIEESNGGTEPDHPAPVLTLLPAAGPEGGSGATSGASSAPAATSAPAGDAAPAASDTGGGNGTATTALVLGILGLLAGLVGLGVALTSRRAGGGAPAAAAQADPVSGVKE